MSAGQTVSSEPLGLMVRWNCLAGESNCRKSAQLARDGVGGIQVKGILGFITEFEGEGRIGVFFLPF